MSRVTFPVLAPPGTQLPRGAAEIAIAPVGAGSVIAYRSASPNSRLLWFDRAGRELDSFPVAADYHHPRLSPDEKSMLIEKTDP